MDRKTCLEKLKLIGTLAFANVDASGLPQVRNISAIHYELDDYIPRMYFLTSRGKPFAKDLLRDGHVQVLGLSRFGEMIRASGVAVLADADKQTSLRDLMYEEYPELAYVYPGDTKDINVIYELTQIVIEYFNLGERPIFRETYSLESASKPAAKGFLITDACIECGTCIKHCPQSAIVSGSPFAIKQEHCLHCGACYEVCPAGAVKDLEQE